MKLNADCVRDILLDIEETAGINNPVHITRENYINMSRCYKYDYDTLAYHLRQCYLNDYFFNCTPDYNNYYTIIDLTPKAHEFIANIREDNNWNKVKSILAKIGSYSLSVIATVAANVIQTNIMGMV